MNEPSDAADHASRAANVSPQQSLSAPPPLRFTDPRVAGYTILRLAMGISMLTHGINRIGVIPGFAAKTAQMFAATWLPPSAVLGFAWSTPPVELVIGLLVFSGWFTRTGLILGGLWMVALIFGSNLLEHYDWVGIQLVYSLIFCVLLQNLEANLLSLDHVLKTRAGRTVV